MSHTHPGILSYDSALATLLEAVVPRPVTSVGVREALGRVLGDDLRVPTDMPDLPRSAVDGFAVQSNQGPRFTVVQEVRAGTLPAHPLAPGEAAAIMTGAVVPEGADCLAMLEDCRRDGNRITVNAGLTPGALINPTGHEARAEDVFATAGTPVSAPVHATLFSAGLRDVPVHRRPRVSLLISGDELREVEDGPAPGQVFNANRYLLEAVCAGLGVPVQSVHTVGDDETALRDLLPRLDSESDLILTSGGVSRGRYDHLGRILRGPGYDLLVPGSAIKPGRPLHVARSHGGPLVLGLPGYPSALLTNVFLYVVPALKKAAGRRDFATRWFNVTLADPMRYRPGRLYLNRVRLEWTDTGWLAHDPGSQISSHFLNFARCHGLVRMPLTRLEEHANGSVSLAAGTEVPALDFGWELS